MPGEFNTANELEIRVVDTVEFQDGDKTRTPFIASGLPRFWPVSFARATNGYVYMASGVKPMAKWDGIEPQVREVGVPAPASAMTILGRKSGTIVGIYSAYCRFVDIDGNVSNLSPISNTTEVGTPATEDTEAAGVREILYKNIPVPTDNRVTKKQILRNTNGQADTYYVDLELTNLSAVKKASSRTDDQLRARTAVPFFDTENRDIVDRHGLPRDDKPILAYFNNRLFAAGEVRYQEGHVEVTNGSKTVQGIGTEWTSEFASRRFYVVGHDDKYGVSSCDEVNQTLTLGKEYTGEDDKFAEYVVRVPRTQPSKIYWSEAAKFDSWPIENSMILSSSEDIDEEITGLISTQSFLFVVQRRHTYRLSYLLDPVIDGGVFLSLRRGCANHRCWVTVGEFIYMLDDQGIYRWDGSSKLEDVSLQIQDIFWTEHDEGETRINWNAYRHFHCVHDRNDATIRWYVSFNTDRLPRNAICYAYNQEHWWIEEYPWQVGASGTLKTIDPLPIIAGYPGRVYGVNIGNLDVTDPKTGDTRAAVISATQTSVTTRDKLFPALNVVGAPIAIVSGRGKGQYRIIEAYSDTTQRIDVTQPWDEIPDDTSTFQIGAISWVWKSPWHRWAMGEKNQSRRIAVFFGPTRQANQCDLRIYRDFSKTPKDWMLDWPTTPAASDGVSTTKNDPDAEIDLTQTKGFAQVRLDSWKMLNEWRGDFVAIELRGFGGPDRVKIHGLDVEGAD